MQKLVLITLSLIILSFSVFAADYSIASLHVLNDDVRVNQQQFISVVISNDSNTVVAIHLTMYEDDNEFFSFLYTVSDASDFNAIIPWKPLTPGDKNISAFIDANDDDLFNNSRMIEVYVARGADLSISGIFVPSIVLPDEQITAQIFVTNIGDVISPFATLAVLLDGNDLEEINVYPLKSTEFKRFDINFSVSSLGDHILRAIVHSTVTSEEYDESNNEATTTFRIQTTLTDESLTRDEIERLINDVFQNQRQVTQEQLNACNDNADALRQQLNAMTANYNSCESDRVDCLPARSKAESDLLTCIADKAELAANERTRCDDKLFFQQNTDQNLFEERYHALQIEKAAAVDSLQQQLNSRSTQAIIGWAVVFIGVLLYLGYVYIQNKKKGMIKWS